MKVLVTGNLPEEILGSIQAEHEVVANHEDRPMDRQDILAKVTDKDGLLCMVTDRIDIALMDKAPRLKIIANFGVGYDNIDVASATQRGIWVSNTPGVLTDTTADLTFALILAISRRIIQGDAITRAGQFKWWAPFLFLGTDVAGKTLGIIGLGAIGKAVAMRARGFGMTVLYHNRHRLTEQEEQKLCATHAELNTLLSESDFVSLHVPLTPETRHLMGRAELQLMKPTAFLINASRGPVVDEEALVETLRSSTIAGAALDVYENEPALTPGLVELDNVVLLPHVGSATREARTRMGQLAVDNLLKGLRGEIPPNCLNPRLK
jgi:glyoxylate reductase